MGSSNKKVLLLIGIDCFELMTKHEHLVLNDFKDLTPVTIITPLTGPRSLSAAANRVTVPARYRGSQQEMECYYDGIIAGMKHEIIAGAFGPDLSIDDVVEVMHVVEETPGDPESARYHMSWLLDMLPKTVKMHRIEPSIV